MTDIDPKKISPTIDAKIARLDAKLRAAGKMQDEASQPACPVITQQALDASAGQFVPPAQPDQGCADDQSAGLLRQRLEVALVHLRKTQYGLGNPLSIERDNVPCRINAAIVFIADALECLAKK